MECLVILGLRVEGNVVAQQGNPKLCSHFSFAVYSCLGDSKRMYQSSLCLVKAIKGKYGYDCSGVGFLEGINRRLHDSSQTF